MNDKIAYDKLLRNLRIIDDRMTRAGHRLGLDPYRTDHELNLLVDDGLSMS